MDFRDTPGGSVFETTGAYQFKEKRILRALEALRVLGIDTTIRVKRALGAAVEFPVRMEVTRESHTRRETITLHIARELFVGYLVHLLCHRADRLALEDIQQIAAIAVCLMDPRDDKKDLSSIPVEMSPGSVDLRRESSATV